MRPILSLLESTRLYLLVYTLPYALLWLRSGPGETFVADGSGETHVVGLGGAGVLLVIAHAALVLLHATTLDARTLWAGGRPRLALARDADEWIPPVVEFTRIAAAGALVVVTIPLLFLATWPALLVVLFAAGILLLTGGVAEEGRPARMLFAEILWPLAMLILPLAVFSGLADAREAPLTPGAVSATTLGVLALCAYVLLCLIRDLPADAGEGRPTLATALGRAGATVVLFAVLAAFVVIGAHGAGAGRWPWAVGALAGVAAMVALWAVADDAEEIAPTLWTIANLALAFILLAGD